MVLFLFLNHGLIFYLMDEKEEPAKFEFYELGDYLRIQLEELKENNCAYLPGGKSYEKSN